MNAETPKAAELNVPQAFLLLATKDTDGKPEVPMPVLRTTLAGAILAELHLIGAVRLEGKHVRATENAPQTDFERELEIIRHKSRPHTPKRWVSMFEGRAEVQRVYEALVSLGILEHAGERHLGVFRQVRYPEKDHAPEAALLRKIQTVLTGEPAEAPAPGSAAPTPGKPEAKKFEARTLALIALLQAAGLLARLFPEADRTWTDELAKDYWPARAVEGELLMIRLGEEEAANL